MPDFKVGDTVVHVDGRGRREPTVQTTLIVRVGRKYAYIRENHRDIPFDLETGQEKTNYGYGSQIWIPAKYEEFRHRQQLLRIMERLGGLKFVPHAILNDNPRMTRLRTDRLEAIVELLDDEDAWERGSD